MIATGEPRPVLPLRTGLIGGVASIGWLGIYLARRVVRFGALVYEAIKAAVARSDERVRSSVVVDDIFGAEMSESLVRELDDHAAYRSIELVPRGTGLVLNARDVEQGESDGTVHRSSAASRAEQS